jgi:hypothetical protein
MQTHPYYQEWKNYNQIYNPFEGAKYNENNKTTSSDTYKGLHSINTNYRYASGWQPGDRYNTLMSDRSLQFMSGVITENLKGVHPEGKNIIVPNDTIRSVADSIFQTSVQSADHMQKMVINYIANAIKNEYETIENNNKLDIWVTKYDIESGLQQFNSTKLNYKKRNYGTVWKY